jgi:hypothetical protein
MCPCVKVGIEKETIMLDILDSVRKSMALQSETKLNIKNSSQVNKAIALYKRTAGEVSHSEQLLLDQNYVNAVQAVANVPEVDNKRIGTLINIYV